MDVHKVEATIAKLIDDASTVNAQSQWLQFVLGGVAFLTIALLTKLTL